MKNKSGNVALDSEPFIDNRIVAHKDPFMETLEQMKQEASKNDILDDKIMMQLLPPLASERIAEVFTYGAKKYDSWNWSKGLDYSRIYGALQRHITTWYKGENLDSETSKSHLAHAGCCIMMLLELEELRPDLDDRPKHYKNNK